MGAVKEKAATSNAFEKLVSARRFIDPGQKAAPGTVTCDSYILATQGGRLLLIARERLHRANGGRVKRIRSPEPGRIPCDGSR